jgi:SAM-dependent methyltransferase
MTPIPADAPLLHNLDVAAKFYDERFGHGYMEDWPRAKRERVAALIRELPLPAQGRALDFGCGTGVFTRVLRTALPRWEVHGTDLSATAVRIAGEKNRDCRFYEINDCSAHAGEYDLVFTHHVLEHVSNLASVSALLASLVKSSGSMMHILPCGDAGSLERMVCELRLGGIDTASERRFFYEEEGHLRRLDTERLVALWAGRGFRLERAYYANQWFGGVRFLTDGEARFILDVTDPAMAKDAAARRKLRRLRTGLLAVWAFRKPVVVVRNKLRSGCAGIRDIALLSGGVLAFPISWMFDRCVRGLANLEWRVRRHRPGSEMYVHLARRSGGV